MVSGDLSDAGGVEFWRIEAERWRAEAERLAADEVVLRARVADLEGQVGALAEKVSVLARLAFGTSSEKAAKRAPGGEGTAGDDTTGEGWRKVPSPCATSPSWGETSARRCQAGRRPRTSGRNP